MSAFSATEAALEGFRITRENPKAFLRWAMVSFGVSLLGVLITVSMPAEVREAMATLDGDATPNFAQLFEALLWVSPILVFGLTFQCMMAAAVYRLIFRHDDIRFGYIRLGRDEIRLMGLTLIYLGLLIVTLAALTLVAGVIMALVNAIAGASVAVVVGGSAQLFFLGLVLFVAVRLSLAPVITFAERRIAVFQSWTVTRGHFWRLLGAYVLAICCIVVISLLAMVLFMAAAGIVVVSTGGQMSDLGAIFNPDQSSLRSYLSLGMIAYMVLGSIVSALYYAVIAAPGAVAYQQLTSDEPGGLETKAEPD